MFRNISRIILYLTTLDLTLFWGWGLVSPFLAIFITREMGGTISQAGLAAALAYMVQALLQIPIGLLLDKKRGERDDFTALACSLILASVIGLGFFFAYALWHIYVLQFAQGIRSALYFASWSAIFSRHLNKGRESFEWSLDWAGVGFGFAFAAALGGYLADAFGFRLVFLLVSLFSFLSLIPLFLSRRFLNTK